MNTTAKLARGVALGVSAVWAAVLFFSGLDLDWQIQRGLAYLPSVAGVLVVAFDLWLWKIPGVSRITGRPHLYGTWRTVLTPNAESHIPTGGNHGPIVAAMVIEQTFWTTAVHLYTEQSRSSSVSAALVTDPDSKQVKNMYFNYSNRARQAHNMRSYPHQGTTVLHVTGTSPRTLDGSYWTDRLTVGDVDLTFIDRRTDRSAADALVAADESQD